MNRINPIARRLSVSARFPYSIVILLMCAVTVFFSSPGQTYFSSVFVEHYIAEFGWSRSLISSLYSAGTLLSGMLLFLVGRLADKIGPRKVTLAAGIILGFSSLLASLMAAPWLLFITFFLGRINGQGTLTLMPATIIPRWFVKKRALAFSLVSLGSVLGSALLPPLNNHLISLFGWRVTWRIWAVLIWMVFIPLAYTFLFNKPKQLGLLPDSGKPGKLGEEIQEMAIKIDMQSSWSLKEAMRTLTFWGTILIQILNPMLITGLTFHFISIMGSKGIAAQNAPFLLSIMALTSLPSTLLSGFILNKIKTQYGGLILSLLLVFSMFSLLMAQSMAMGIVFAVLQGMAQGVQAVWVGLVWPEYYGMKHLGSIRGFAMTISVMASALGPVMFGAVFDMTGSYAWILIASVGLALTGMACALLSRPPLKKVFKNEYEP